MTRAKRAHCCFLRDSGLFCFSSSRVIRRHESPVSRLHYSAHYSPEPQLYSFYLPTDRRRGVFFFRSASRFEIGSVVDYHEGAVEHHHIDDRSAGQLDVRAHHHHIHIRSHRHATILQGIHARKIRSRSCAEVIDDIRNVFFFSRVYNIKFYSL